MFQKIRNTIIVYFLSIVAIYSLILKQANPTFLQNNEMSVRLFAYGVLNNFGNVALALLLILIGYCINGSAKWVLKKYFYIYIINVLTFIGLFLWSRSFTIADLYNVILPISRNTYPLVVGAILAIAFKDNTKKWLDKYSLNLMLIFYGIVFTLPTLFDKDLFGLGNGNNILTAFLLTTLGVIFSTKSYDSLGIKKLTGVGGLLLANVALSLTMPYVSLKMHGDLSTAYRFDVLTSATVVGAAVAVFLLAKKVIAKAKLPEYSSLLTLVFVSNTFIISKLISGEALLRVWLLRSVEIVTVIFILGLLVAIVDSKEHILEQKWKLSELPLVDWLKLVKQDFGDYLIENRYRIINIVILYVLAYCSIIFMSPDFSAPHMGDKATMTIFSYTFFCRQQMIWLNLVLFYLIYRVLLGISNRFWVSAIINYLLVAIAVVADVIKIHYRSEPILPTEVTMTSAYSEILEMVPKSILWIALVGIFLLIVVILVCEKKAPQKRIGIVSRIMGVILATAIFGSSTKINHDNSISGDFLASYGNNPTFENQEHGAQQNGALQQFLNNIDVTIMKSESSYSKKRMARIEAKYTKLATKINRKRKNKLTDQTMIFNLSESLANPNHLEGITLSKNPLPFIDKLKTMTTSGMMISSGYGGGTANMEYMALTGLPMSNFSPTIATAYTQVVSESRQSITINDYFKKSTAIHPYSGAFYSRKSVYQEFGFQKFMYLGSKDKIKHQSKIGSSPYISDETAYKNVLDLINGYHEGQFINLVTMQNHMPYDGYYDNADKFQVEGNIDDGEKSVISNYSAGISYTDKSVARFVKHIDEIKKPITLVFYGDHLPGIYAIDTNKLKAREADYFIYSNKYARSHGAKKLTKVKHVSPNEFIALATKQTNTKISAYYALLTKVQEELPAMKVYAFHSGKKAKFVDNQGKTIKYSQLTKKQKELYNDLKLVQYDLTTGNQYLCRTGFFNIK